MARLDKVKNLAGLAEWYATNERLRGLVNLVIVGERVAGRGGVEGRYVACSAVACGALCSTGVVVLLLQTA